MKELLCKLCGGEPAYTSAGYCQQCDLELACNGIFPKNDPKFRDVLTQNFIWERAVLLQRRYYGSFIGYWYNEMDGFTTALNWIRRAYNWCVKNKHVCLAKGLTELWELDQCPNSDW